MVNKQTLGVILQTTTFTNIFDEAISAVYDKNLSGQQVVLMNLATAQGPVTQANNEVRQAAIRFHSLTTAKMYSTTISK